MHVRSKVEVIFKKNIFIVSMQSTRNLYKSLQPQKFHNKLKFIVQDFQKPQKISDAIVTLFLTWAWSELIFWKWRLYKGFFKMVAF